MPVPRKRSCAQCRHAKARCSLTSPKCSRCISRGIGCDYTAAFYGSGTPELSSNSWEGAIIGSAQPAADSNQFHTAFLDLEETAAVQWNSDSSPSEITQFTRAIPYEIEEGDHTFRFSDPLIQNLDGLSDAPWPQYPSAPNIPAIESQHPPVGEHVFQTNYLTELSKRLFMTDFAAPPWPSPKTLPLKMHNLLSRRSVEKLGSTLTANYLFSTIQSYPEMLSTLTFPPFVHQYFADLTSDLPEPLANCMSFVPMFHSKTPTSEKFVHKTLFLEAQRLHNEFHSFNDWMKLAAIQTLAVYIILLASEKERCQTLSVVVILAVGEIATKLYNWNIFSEDESKGNIDWDEWRFIESKRRTMILMWLLEMLVDMNIGIPASASCRTLDQIPLPCTKDVWEASSKAEWETKYKSHLSSRKSGELLLIGDLRTAQDSNCSVLEKSRVDDLHIWSSNADSFGGLVMLAVC